MTTKVMFYIGLNDKDAHVQVIHTLDARNIVSRTFVAHGVDGATISGGQGIYKHADGTIVIEQTIIVQVFEFGSQIDVNGICADLKRMLNQESIAVERLQTDSMLV